jgi:hypothetical protein
MNDLSIERAIDSVLYVARCASVDADKLGLLKVSIALAGAMDAATNAQLALANWREETLTEREVARPCKSHTETI